MSGVRILEESIRAGGEADGSPEKDLISFPYIPKKNLLVQFNRLDSQVNQVSSVFVIFFRVGRLTIPPGES